MSQYIPDKLRSLVKERALSLCEYCLMHEDHLFFTFQVDHIIGIKHGGKTEAENLAYSCIRCNRNKGSDLSSVLLPDLQPIPFFNPRIHQWETHFELDGPEIIPLSKIGQVTDKIFQLNSLERVSEREVLINDGIFPHPNVLKYIGLHS